jgi:hypothetical protein
LWGTHKSIAALVSDATNETTCILQIGNINNQYQYDSNININSSININNNIISVPMDLPNLGHAYTKEGDIT